MGLIELIQSDYTVLLIPVISAFIGWFTNVVAVKMMFYPTEFVGIRPYLGWQGTATNPVAGLRVTSTARPSQRTSYASV